LANLPALTELDITACGGIEELGVLRTLPALRTLRYVGCPALMAVRRQVEGNKALHDTLEGDALREVLEEISSC
jgi:hypothetical protein